GDVRIISLDKRAKKEVELTYSIKSSLGSPATIFNASKKTNFKYEIKGINAVDVAIINLIETETKLLDRIKKIHELGGIVSFDSVVSNALDYNLRMIDSNLPTYLGNTLLYSYENNNKDLKEIFIKANQFSDKKLGYKKLGDFLDGTSFGFIPSIKWDGIRTVNGGLLIIKDDGEVVILDLTYFKESVLKYMINESKLDSPSSTRFRMLEVYKENGKFFFTLNLQVRYKK
ncbi:MAG: HpaII family restriction endonuclease, partial [Bacillales bacterium]|nr:HpaII family restriction endonuclease [Bacillales bacterium]